MVKSVFVPTAPAPASAPIAAAPVKVKTETKEEECAHDDDVFNSNSNKEPTVDFSSVFHELQTFQQDHNGSLAIPQSHPALSRIIDSLSDLSSVGIIGLSRKRWEEQMKTLQSYREKYGHVNVPQTNHHPLGNWARIQREQYRLYEEGEPNELTKKRYGKLKAIGFGDQEGVVTTANAKSSSRDHSDKDKDDKDDAKPSKKSSGKQKKKAVDEGRGATTNKQSDDKTTANIYAKQEDGSEQAAAAVNGVKNTERVKVELSEELRNDGGKRLKGKCDVCEKSDGFWGHNLQQCQTCGLLVHELCYGLAETGSKDPNFVCHACKAVGSSVEVNVPSKLGGCGDKMGKKREMIQQNERPSQCILCSHDKGIHAMHPLLDTHGPDGRQLVVDHSFRDRDDVARKEKRLAWVHTLCAQVICANPRTASSVYGCDKHGNFYGDGEEEYCDDGREEEFEVDNTSSNNNNNKSDETNNANNKSVNDEQEDGDQEDENCLNDLTSFAIATEEAYAQNIQDHRGLKCYICGKKDKSYKIPLQCIAGDQEEHGRWKNRHKRGTECFMGMHVGCARWGCVESEGSHLEKIGGKLCRQCWFTPGRDDNDDDEGSKDSHGEDKNRTVAHCYCKIHARDLVLNNPKNKGKTTGNTAKSSPVGKAKAKSSRKKPPAKEATRRKKPGGSAQPSLKKSLNSISKKSGKKNGSRKRKADEEDEDDDAKGAFGVPSKKSKVGFATSLVQYPVRGRSASALVGMSGAYVVPPPPAAPMSNPSALASSNTNKGPVTGILRRTSSTGSFGLPQQGPSGPIPYAPMSGSIKDPDTPEQDFGSSKRKAAPAPDLPVSGSVKRIKFED